MSHLRVLFLSSDDLVAQVRLLPMLGVLQAQGHVALTVVDRDLNAQGDRRGMFDVCLAHRNLGKRQIGWLRDRSVPLLYDIDDLLTTGSAREAVRQCLARASVVTAPSRRLLAALDAESGAKLAGKSAFLPNAGREEAAVGLSSIKPRLIWISSAIPQAGDGLAQVCQGIAAAAAERAAETILVGRFPPQIVGAFARVQHVPWIAPAMLLDWLAARPLIAVAPLSTDLPPAAQAFADCKSDIKIAQFGSCGIAGVYSPAAPYAESDLPRRLVATNDAAAWTAEINAAWAAFPDEGRMLAHHPAFTARRPSALAAQLLIHLQKAAASAPPFAFRAIGSPRIARAVERKIRNWLR